MAWTHLPPILGQQVSYRTPLLAGVGVAVAPARASICVTAPGFQTVAQRAVFASFGDGERLMSSITGSMFASATIKPSNTCARSRALRRSNSVRRVTTSRRWRRNASSSSFSDSSFGWPSTRPTMLMPNTLCSGVCL